MKKRALWLAFLRSLIAILVFALALALYLVFNPASLQSWILTLPIPGVVEIPSPGLTPLPPRITAPRGAVPGGTLAFSGEYEGGTIACAFLMELEDGQQVGVSAAHATPALPADTPAQFFTPEWVLAADLEGQIARGSAFMRTDFSMDYVLWAVASGAAPERFLKPDPRGGGEAGEQVLVFGRSSDGAGGSMRWPGVVMSVTQEAIWIQLEDSFDPRGYSGCPVVSQYTGRLIGMAVAGENKHPVVMGLHPVGSLVEKAAAALPAP